jgi:hypothetical protein
MDPCAGRSLSIPPRQASVRRSGWNGYPLLLVSFPEKDIISGIGSGGHFEHLLEVTEPFLQTSGAVPARRLWTQAWECLTDIEEARQEQRLELGLVLLALPST